MNVNAKDLSSLSASGLSGHRLINAKLPPIALFNDVADQDEFEALYAIQALTNPRILNEVGNLRLVPLDEIPFGIRGCHYAAASFTHVNPNGSRFSDGSFGLMYIADTIETAIAEVYHHQTIYWANIPGLHYDRFVFKELICRFDIAKGLDATHMDLSEPMYASNDYTAARVLGMEIKLSRRHSTLKYHSVRKPGSICYALFTPMGITDIIQAKHYEMIWTDAHIQSVSIVAQT